MFGVIGIFDRPDIYKAMIISAMKKLGATEEEVKLLTDETVRIAFQKRRHPEDVAWEILQ